VGRRRQALIEQNPFRLGDNCAPVEIFDRG
jgi:hypothetical protein